MYYMETSNILTSKGTTTIPKYVRDKLGLKPGNRVRFVETKQGTYIIKKDPTLADVQAMNAKLVSKSTKRPTREEISDGMAQQAVERYKRSLL